MSNFADESLKSLFPNSYNQWNVLYCKDQSSESFISQIQTGTQTDVKIYQQILMDVLSQKVIMKISEIYSLFKFSVDPKKYRDVKGYIRQRIIKKCPIIIFTLNSPQSCPIFDAPTPTQYVLLPDPPKESSSKAYILKIFHFFMNEHVTTMQKHLHKRKCANSILDNAIFSLRACNNFYGLNIIKHVQSKMFSREFIQKTNGGKLPSKDERRKLIEASDRFISISTETASFKSMINARIDKLKNELQSITDKIDNYSMHSSEKEKIKLLLNEQNAAEQIQDNEKRLMNISHQLSIERVKIEKRY